jgi:hypothetical protein
MESGTVRARPYVTRKLNIATHIEFEYASCYHSLLVEIQSHGSPEVAAEEGIKSKRQKLFSEACVEMQFSLTIYPTLSESLGSVVGFKNIRQLTRRAPDLGYGPRFLSICLAFGLSRFEGESTLPPQAGNTSRWAPIVRTFFKRSTSALSSMS